MTYPLMDQDWVETSRTFSPSFTYPVSTWQTDGSLGWTPDQTFAVNRPSKSFSLSTKIDPAERVLPPQFPSSAFVDASSPEAWNPPNPLSPTMAILSPRIPPSSNPVDIPSDGSPVKSRPADIEGELNKQNLYKTELCRNWMETGQCRYGTKCQFAHGHHEIRSIMRHPKYKTEICRTFHTTGTCAYGKRCRFVHHVGEMRTNDGSDAAVEFHLQMSQLKLGNLSPSFGTHGLQSTSSPSLTPRSPAPSSPMRHSSSATSGLASSIGSSASQSPPRSMTIPSFSLSPKSQVEEESISYSDEQDNELAETIEAVVVAAASVSIAEEDSEEDSNQSTTSKKTSSHRLPFFAKLNSWKKK